MSEFPYNPTIDLREELSSKIEQYAGTESLMLDRNWLSNPLKRSFDAIDRRTEPRAYLETTIVCCLTHGIRMIQSSTAILELSRLREQLKRKLEESEFRDIEEMIGFECVPFSSIMAETKSHFGKAIVWDEGGRIRLPKELKESVRHLARDLGADSKHLHSLIVLLSSMAILSTQANIPSRDRLSEGVQSFFRKVELRRKVAAVLLEE